MSSQDGWSPFRPPMLPLPLTIANSPPREFESTQSRDTHISHRRDATSYRNNSPTDRYTQRPYTFAHSPTITQPTATHVRSPTIDRHHGIPPPYERRQRISFVTDPDIESHVSEKIDSALDADHRYRDEKSRGMLSRIIDLREEEYNEESEDPAGHNDGRSERNFDSTSQVEPSLLRRRRPPSGASPPSMGSQVVDEDDPRITGKRLAQLDDTEDMALSSLRHLDYKARRKARNHMKIIYNITSLMNRHKFILVLARALMILGAPSHRIVSQLVAASNILEVNASFIYTPDTIICNFSDPDTKTTESHFVKCSSGLDLGGMHALHAIYRRVMHDELSARKATEMIEELLVGIEKHSLIKSSILSLCLSALICPLAFNGCFIDMWIAGFNAAIISYLQNRAAKSKKAYDEAPKITTCLIMSFITRGLSSVSSDTICYSAVTSASIISLLPGFSILSSSLELGSKEIISGSVKMVHALVYTMLLGLSLQIGEQLYFSTNTHAGAKTMSALSQAAGITLQGAFTTLNSTIAGSGDTIPTSGKFFFNTFSPSIAKDFVGTCYRPDGLPWYRQTFPFWTKFIIVPLFSILSSIANHAPLRSKQLPVMTIISCVSYATNELAGYYIRNSSGIVSAVGAFTVGILGNLYSRKMGGTAFASMVTGVLFLVPSGLSQEGGITANGSGLSMESAMISTVIGITVGLFMSQALVYAFGRRKNAASFSF